jgi:hypothetical protein
MNLDLEFNKYFDLEEAWAVLEQINGYPLLEVRQLQQKEISKKTLPYVDPVTRKPWRPTDKIRHLQAIKKNEKRKGHKAKDIWVSFTDVDKLGIYPKAGDGGTPFGIYAFPIDYVIKRWKSNEGVPFSSRPYIQVFRIREKKQLGEKATRVIQIKPTEKEKWYDYREKKGFDFNKFRELVDFNQEKAFRELQAGLSDQIRKYIQRIPQGLVHQDSLNQLTRFVQQKVSNFFRGKEEMPIKQVEKDIPDLRDNLRDPHIEKKREGYLSDYMDLDVDEFLGRMNTHNNFDYYDEDIKKYVDINLEKGTAKDASNDQTVKLDDIFAGTIGDYYPAMRDKWENYKSKEKDVTPLSRLILSPKWQKVVEKIIKFIQKSFKNFINKQEEQEQVKFPFADEIKKFAKANNLDWMKAVRSADARAGVGGFLYRAASSFQTQLSRRDRTGNKPVHWTRVIRAMGIDGFADRFHSGTIYSGGSERTQGFFFEKDALEHIHQIDNHSHIDRTKASGAPSLELGNLIKDFKKKQGINPNRWLQMELQESPAYETLEQLATRYQVPKTRIEAWLREEELVDQNVKPNYKALSKKLAAIVPDKKGHAIWRWNVPALSTLFRSHGHYTPKIHTPAEEYVVRWSVNGRLSRPEVKKIRKKYGLKAKQEIEELEKKKTPLKKEIKSIRAKFNREADEEIANLEEIQGGVKRFDNHSDAIDFKTTRTEEIRKAFPNLDLKPGGISGAIETEWLQFVEKEFKKAHNIPEDGTVPKHLSSRYSHLTQGARNVTRYAGPEIEKWSSFNKAHDPTMTKEKGKAYMHGMQIELPQTDFDTKRGTKLFGATPLHRTIIGLSSTLNNLRDRIWNVKAHMDSERTDWQNEFDSLLAQTIKVVRSYNALQRSHKEEIGRNAKAQETVRHMQSTLSSIPSAIQRILSNEKLQHLWKGIWSSIRQKGEYLIRLLHGEIVKFGRWIATDYGEYWKDQNPHYRKRKYMGAEEYKKFFNILYPGVEKLENMPEDLREHPATKMAFQDIEPYGKEGWHHLLQYQQGKGMIPGKEKYKELYHQWDWIWDDTALMALPQHIKEQPLSMVRSRTVLDLISSDPLLEKLVDYQVAKGIMAEHGAKEALKRLLHDKAFLQGLQDDPAFQEIPKDVLNTPAWNLGQFKALELGENLWKKLIQYQSIFIDSDVKGYTHDQMFKQLEALDLKDLSIVEKHPQEFTWKDLVKNNLDSKEAWSKYLGFLRDNYMHGMSWTLYDRLNAHWAPLFEKGMPEDYKAKYVAQEKLPTWDLNIDLLKKTFKTPEEFEKYIRYGTGIGDFSYSLSSKYRRLLEMWQNQLKGKTPPPEPDEDDEWDDDDDDDDDYDQYDPPLGAKDPYEDDDDDDDYDPFEDDPEEEEW